MVTSSIANTEKAAIAKSYGISEATFGHLLNRYGSLFVEVLEATQSDEKLALPLSTQLPYIGAEILYAVTHEGAMSIADVMERRSRIWFEASDYGLASVNSVADVIAPHLGWKAAQKRASIAEYKDLVKRAKTSAASLHK